MIGRNPNKWYQVDTKKIEYSQDDTDKYIIFIDENFDRGQYPSNEVPRVEVIDLKGRLYEFHQSLNTPQFLVFAVKQKEDGKIVFYEISHRIPTIAESLTEKFNKGQYPGVMPYLCGGDSFFAVTPATD